MLKINNLKKKYDHFSLECSLNIKPGYISGFIGQNGAGKSTLFKSILGLISIDEGHIEMFGKDTQNLSAKDKQKIGVVLADSGFSEYLTIYDIILILVKSYEDFEKENFLLLCEHFSLPLHQQIKEFSTGMKVKLKILIAMTHHASLLILDEPTAGLDVIARDEVLDMLRELMVNNEECIILMSSHISSDLESLCDDIYMIHDGHIVVHEDTDVLLSQYALLKMSEEQYHSIDHQYILKKKNEAYGYCCLTNQKQYYKDNYPDIVIENGNIDELMFMYVKGA